MIIPTLRCVKYTITKLFRKGRVIKVNGDQNMLGWSRFSRRFGDRIPVSCEVAVACRIGLNSSLPSGWALVARAAENIRLGETIFIVASARQHVDDPGIIFGNIKAALRTYCASGIDQFQAIWIPRGNNSLIQLALEKYGLYLPPSPYSGKDSKRNTKTKATNRILDL